MSELPKWIERRKIIKAYRNHSYCVNIPKSFAIMLNMTWGDRLKIYLDDDKKPTKVIMELEEKSVS